jgi:FAD/FMN-containing dehydrogenase
VLTSPGRLLAWECDGFTVHRSRPRAVVLPESTAEVQAVVRCCTRRRVPFVPRGAGTCLSGGPTAGGDAVVIDLARMRKVLHVSTDDLYAVVQPGVVNLDLTTAVHHHGLHYAPDPSSQSVCTIGGNLAENSGGPHCFKYGMTTDHVLGALVVLPDGELAAARRVRRGHAGPGGLDLLGVFCGSEGTFGIATEITVRLCRDQQSVRTLLGAFATMTAACRTVSDIVAAGLVPAALEILDQATIRAVEASVYRAGYPEDAAAVLLVELDGPLDVLAEEAAEVRAFFAQHGALQRRGGEHTRRAQTALEGPQGRVRRDGTTEHRPLRARRRGAAHAPRGGARRHRRDRREARRRDDQRVPRRRRQPAPEHQLRRPRPGADARARSPPATRSCSCASTSAAASPASTASAPRSSTTCDDVQRTDLAVMAARARGVQPDAVCAIRARCCPRAGPAPKWRSGRRWSPRCSTGVRGDEHVAPRHPRSRDELPNCCARRRARCGCAAAVRASNACRRRRRRARVRPRRARVDRTARRRRTRPARSTAGVPRARTRRRLLARIGLELPCPGGGTLGGLFAADPIGAARSAAQAPRTLLLGAEAMLADGTRVPIGRARREERRRLRRAPAARRQPGACSPATQLHLRLKPRPRAGVVRRDGPRSPEAIALGASRLRQLATGVPANCS